MNEIKRVLDRFGRVDWYSEIAQIHADADASCGRKWECACAACRVARREGFAPSAAGEK